MGLPAPQQTGFTLEDWRLWEGRWELIDGVAFDMTPAPSLEHQRVASLLHLRIGTALEIGRKASGGNCEAFFAPIDVFLGGGVVQPDLVVVCDDARKTEKGIVGPPDLVVEILSPRTASRDHTRKRWLYEAAGVPEYLIVDPEVRVALLLRLKDGRYEEALRAEWGSVLELLGQTLSITLD